MNRQVLEDFLPVWGSGYTCKLRGSPFAANLAEVIRNDPVQAEAVIYLVDEPSISQALGYHDVNNAEVAVGFVFTDLGEWTMTFSHEVLEMIVDPTVNIFVPGPDPRAPDDPTAWLLHTYEVCDAVERTGYDIDGVAVSNFVTPQYFSVANAPGTQNDFLGVGVASFGVVEGCHLGTVDPTDFSWVQILGNELTAKSHPHRLDQFLKCAQQRPRAGARQYASLNAYQKTPIKGGSGLSSLTSLSRGGRKQQYMLARRC